MCADVTQTPLACVLLAAGKGTRMKSSRPKVMHKLAGQPMINRLLNTVEQLKPDRIITVVGPDMDDVTEAVKPHKTVIQKKRLGTGDALKTALSELKGFKGDVLILLGDAPLITLPTLRGLIQARHGHDKVGMAVLGTHLKKPKGYGRMILGPDSFLKKIVEEKDASPEEKRYTLINTGTFCVESDRLEKWVSKISNNNAQNEYYITDLPVIADQEDDVKTTVSICDDPNEVRGINSRRQLAELEMIIQNQLRDQAMEDGATLRDPQTVYFSFDTKLGQDVIVEPHVCFGPNVIIGDNVHILSFTHLEGAHIEQNVSIGPFARIRPDSHIKQGARIGNFVEVKKSTIGAGAKANHLSYIGDAELGDHVNFSAGAITVNYDGFQKHKTVIGEHVMIGCNANLVAPVQIGNGAYVAAGSTITEDVPENALSVARNRPIIRDGWATKRRKMKKEVS